MKYDALKEKSFAFAIRMVKLFEFLENKQRYFSINKQILRSGTNPGAMVREAKNAESPKDFIHKLSIALKEIGETIYWLELLFETNYINKEQYKSLKIDAEEILKILTASIKTKKENLRKEDQQLKINR